MNFLESIKQKVKTQKKTIVLPETYDSRVLEAAHIALKEELADIILIGDKNEIINNNKDFDLSKATFIDPNNYEKLDELIDSLVELRKAKGMTAEKARELLTKDYLYLGVMLVKHDIADGMVAGAANSTANVLRPSLQILKTAPNTEVVSTFFIMDVHDQNYGENGILVFSDCALMQNPNAKELAAIAKSAAKSFKSMVGADPRISMLSYSTKGSATHPDIDKVIEATKLVKESEPDLKIDGELQLDASIVQKVADLKAPNSEVAGKANILVFPNLDAGNIGYKLVQRFAKADAYGPITQGLSKPVNDLSRGCNSNDIVGVIAFTALQAQQK